MFIIPILLFIGGLVLFLSLIGGVVYAVVHKSQNNDQGQISTSKITMSEIVSNFFNFALLLTNIISIISILFAIIDEIFKDEISNGAPSMYYNYNSYSDLHSAISLLVIVFPLSLALSYWIRNQHIKKITEPNSPVKKFTIGATMIASLIAVCGSLFTIVYQYLEGDMSSRFVAKVITSFVLSAILFAYYRIQFTKGQTATVKYQNIFAIVSSIFIIAICVYSIVLTGSPSQIRKEKFDDTRLSDLSNIQQNVLSYWQSHRLLPKDLSSLTDSLNGTSISKDPRTGDSYEYELVKQSETINGRTSEAVFKLCASFQTERDTSAKFEELKKTDAVMYDMKSTSQFNNYYRYDQTPFWNHKAERTCFTRTIDPIVYLPSQVGTIPSSQAQPVQILND